MKHLLLLILTLIFSGEIFAQLPLANTYQEDKQRIEKLQVLAEDQFYHSPDTALLYAYEALKIAQKNFLPSQIVKSYIMLGRIYLLQQKLENALKNYQLAYKISELVNFKEGLAEGLNGIGSVAYDQKDYLKALTYFKKAEAINYADNEGILINISYAYLQLDNDSLALIYRKKHLGQAMSKNNLIQQKLALTNLGEYYETKKDFTLALKYYQEAEEVIPFDRIDAYLVLFTANIYRQQGKIQQALELQKKALELFYKLHLPYGVIETHNYLAELYLHKNQVDVALYYYKNALEIARSISALKEIYNIAHHLSIICVSNNNFKEAYYYSTLMLQTQDSILTQERIRVLAEMNTKYSTEQLGQQLQNHLIEIKNNEADLKRKNTERNMLIVVMILVLCFGVIISISYNKIKHTNKLLLQKTKELDMKSQEVSIQVKNVQLANNQITQKNKELANLNATKDKFFSIIAHDLKNPFNSLMFTTEVLLKSGRNMNSAKLDKIYNHLHCSAKQGNTLLENLLDWSRTQTGSIQWIPSNVDLQICVEEAMETLYSLSFNKDIEIINEVPFEPEIFVYADKEMLKTVIRNLVSNAIKFTNEGGFVKIEASFFKNENTNFTTPQYALITVEDNGIGICEESKKKLFRIDIHHSTKGTARESGTGLGLILCKEFVEKNAGQIWVESEENKGSKFFFTVPLQK